MSWVLALGLGLLGFWLVSVMVAFLKEGLLGGILLFGALLAMYLSVVVPKVMVLFL